LPLFFYILTFQAAVSIMRLSIVILFITSTLALAACGQKGPLILPEDAAPKPPVVQTNAQPAAPTTTPAPAAR